MNKDKEYRPRLSHYEMDMVRKRRKDSKNNVIVIGDLHEPFCLDEYFDFCVDVKEKYNCGKFVFIGDIIDNHYSSYHESDPDGLSAGEELEMAIKRLEKWHMEFPGAFVTIGNHDRMMMRKAQSAGLSRRWVKDYKDALSVPSWKFIDEIEIDGVVYVHGEGGTARTRMRQELQSIVQGHIHTQAYCEWTVGTRNRCFAMQVGCGIDRHSYAMAYAKTQKKPIIGCAVVLDNGKNPINIIMDK